MLDALQKRGTSGVQREIAEIIFSCRGRKLTKLKNIIDTGSDYHNLCKLMDDITGPLREDILNHISAEARRALEENGGKKFGTKTLSDVDGENGRNKWAERFDSPSNSYHTSHCAW